MVIQLCLGPTCQPGNVTPVRVRFDPITPAADLQCHSNRKHKARAVIGLAGRDQKEGLLREKSRERGIPRDEGIHKHRQRHRHTREHTRTQGASNWLKNIYFTLPRMKFKSFVMQIYTCSYKMYCNMPLLCVGGWGVCLDLCVSVWLSKAGGMSHSWCVWAD